MTPGVDGGEPDAHPRPGKTAHHGVRLSLRKTEGSPASQR
jgi:hypothetical protein